MEDEVEAAANIKDTATTVISKEDKKAKKRREKKKKIEDLVETPIETQDPLPNEESESTCATIKESSSSVVETKFRRTSQKRISSDAIAENEVPNGSGMQIVSCSKIPTPNADDLSPMLDLETANEGRSQKQKKKNKKSKEKLLEEENIESYTSVGNILVDTTSLELVSRTDASSLENDDNLSYASDNESKSIRKKDKKHKLKNEQKVLDDEDLEDTVNVSDKSKLLEISLKNANNSSAISDDEFESIKKRKKKHKKRSKHKILDDEDLEDTLNVTDENKAVDNSLQNDLSAVSDNESELIRKKNKKHKKRKKKVIIDDEDFEANIATRHPLPEDCKPVTSSSSRQIVTRRMKHDNSDQPVLKFEKISLRNGDNLSETSNIESSIKTGSKMRLNWKKKSKEKSTKEEPMDEDACSGNNDRCRDLLSHGHTESGVTSQDGVDINCVKMKLKHRNEILNNAENSIENFDGEINDNCQVVMLSRHVALNEEINIQKEKTRTEKKNAVKIGSFAARFNRQAATVKECLVLPASETPIPKISHVIQWTNDEQLWYKKHLMVSTIQGFRLPETTDETMCCTRLYSTASYTSLLQLNKVNFLQL